MARWWRSVDLFAWGFLELSLALPEKQKLSHNSYHSIIQKQVARFQDSWDAWKMNENFPFTNKRNLQINSWNGCLDDTRMPPKLHEISHLTSWNCWVERGFLVKDSQYKSSSKHEIHCKKKLKFFPPKSRTWTVKKTLWWLSLFQTHSNPSPYSTSFTRQGSEFLPPQLHCLPQIPSVPPSGPVFPDLHLLEMTSAFEECTRKPLNSTELQS